MFRNLLRSLQVSQSESVESVQSAQDYLILDDKAYSVLKRIPCALRDGDAEYLICTCEFKIYWIRHTKATAATRSITTNAQAKFLPFVACAREQGQKYADYVVFAFSHTKMTNWKRVCTEQKSFAGSLLRLRGLFSLLVQLHSKKQAHGNLVLENIFEQDERTWWVGDYNRGSDISMDMDAMDLAAIILEFALQQKIPPVRTEQALLAQFEKLSAQQKEDLAALEFFIRKQISVAQMSKVVEQWMQKFYKFKISLHRGFTYCSSISIFNMLLRHSDKAMPKAGLFFCSTCDNWLERMKVAHLVNSVLYFNLNYYLSCLSGFVTFQSAQLVYALLYY